MRRADGTPFAVDDIWLPERIGRTLGDVDFTHTAVYAELERLAAEKLSAAQAVGEKLSGLRLSISQKAGVDGRLFGSVTNHDIAESLKGSGFDIAKAQVRMPNGPLKTVGEFTVSVAAHTDVVVDITIVVVGETD